MLLRPSHASPANTSFLTFQSFLALPCSAYISAEEIENRALREIYAKQAANRLVSYPVPKVRHPLISRTFKKPDIQELFENNNPCLQLLQTSVDKDNRDYDVRTVAVDTEKNKLALWVKFSRKPARSLKFIYASSPFVYISI
jgi:hypothetical protein